MNDTFGENDKNYVHPHKMKTLDISAVYKKLFIMEVCRHFMGAAVDIT